jgi:hypothetical protein
VSGAVVVLVDNIPLLLNAGLDVRDAKVCECEEGANVVGLPVTEE